mmetsp:Transcript_36522/g.93045  ORF Transcript_36522/g.93045 Transcript_36522/m.93045 type:complete len:218 (-) Transcript_36522:540-1193(-)
MLPDRHTLTTRATLATSCAKPHPLVANTRVSTLPFLEADDVLLLGGERVSVPGADGVRRAAAHEALDLLVPCAAGVALQETVCHPEGKHVQCQGGDNHDDNQLRTRKWVQPTEQELGDNCDVARPLDHKNAQHDLLQQDEALPIKKLPGPTTAARGIAVLARECQLWSPHTSRPVDVLQRSQQNQLDSNTQSIIQREVDPIPIARVGFDLQPPPKGH